MVTNLSYAGLNFIRAAWCPLEFTCKKLSEHPECQELYRANPALGDLEVGDCLRYATQFTYNDRNKHRRSGAQLITAPFGLSPVDFDMFIGLYTYLRSLDSIPDDGKIALRIPFIARMAGLPCTGPKDQTRVQSQLFRLSYVKITNTKAWNSATRVYEPLDNFEPFSLKSMSAPRGRQRTVTLQLSHEFVRILRDTPAIAFPQDEYRRGRDVALRRFYLLAVRDAWNQPHSMIYDADAFCIHQLGYARDADPQRDRRVRRKDRLAKLRLRLKKAEQAGWICPYRGLGDYFQTANTGPLTGRLALRWTRGPALRTKNDRSNKNEQSFELDALYDKLRALHDQDGKPLAAPRYRSLIGQYGRARVDKHLDIVIAQKETHPATIKKSSLAVLINRIQNDYADPAWYPDYRKAKQNAEQALIHPSEAAKNLYNLISPTR